jgi:sulfur dioxygenase
MKTVQLFDPLSSTYTYLLIDTASNEAVLIDPVDTQIHRDLLEISQRQLTLKYILETHVHADHVTSAATLVEHTGAQMAVPAGCGVQSASIQLQDRQTLTFGTQSLTALHTPGHTAGSMCYLVNQQVFTGDTLLINGCGRCDFQSGSALALYQSLKNILFTLPEETIVWPAHDYNGNTQSSIGTERGQNARWIGPTGAPRTQAQFIELMNQLNLSKPSLIDTAVPTNLQRGHTHTLRQDGQAETAIQQSAPAGYSGNLSPLVAYRWWQTGQAKLIDIRSDAERAWVGFIPSVPTVPWKIWPAMQINPQFDEQLKVALLSLPATTNKVMMLCRSGVRSIPAAQRAQSLGYEAYNILEGFEGDPNTQAHRNTINGWRTNGLPWRQN